MKEENDWRLQDQEEYLKGVKLTLKKWSSSNPDWDHDHCEFCWVTITNLVIPESLDEGYTTDDENHWICTECFEDFREMFGWVVGDL